MSIASVVPRTETPASASRTRLAMLSVHSSPIGNIGARDTGGMSIYVREVAREMGKRGMAVDIYTRARDPACSRTVSLGENVRLVHLRAGDEDITRMAIYPHLPTFVRKLERFREENDLRYDLIFSHYWLSGWVGNALRKRWRVPHLTMFHTLGAVKNAVGIGEAEAALRVDTEGQLMAEASYVIAATPREKRDIVRYYGTPAAKVRVVPCGVNLQLFRPGSRRLAKQRLGLGDAPLVLFAGRIEPLKGIDRLILAMARLPAHIKARLVIVGGDSSTRDEVSRLKGLADDIGLNGSVSFAGAVSHEEMPRFYNAADVCVVPSYYESFGLVALESLACGTPVVASDVGDLKHIVRRGETGYIVRDNDPCRLADRISRVLRRPGGSAAAIRASVARFDWSNIAATLMAEFQSVLRS